MGLEFGAFQFGAAEYPLTASTDNTLLQDADPALAAMLPFLTAVFETYFAARLKSQALLHELRLPGAVVTTAALDPTPFVMSDQFQFPIFCLYRKKDAWDDQSIAYGKSTSTLEFAYVLPPLTPVQAADLQPILRSVSVVMRRALTMMRDPGYQDGVEVLKLAGIQRARLVDCTYGGYERIDVNDKFYRALTGTITVVEREQPATGQFSPYKGADTAIDVTDTDGTSVEDFLTANTYGPPVLASVAPATGADDGGTTVVIGGSGFRVNTRPAVYFDGAQADAVEVLSATAIRCVTPAHSAFPTFLADITVVAEDGQTATLSEAFTFTA
jgi:hypothetical protein